MADPSIIDLVAAGIEKLGLAVATVIGLVIVLKWLSQAHLAALNSRITALEAVVVRRDEELRTANEHLLTVQTEAAQEAAKLANTVVSEIRASRQEYRQFHLVLARLLDYMEEQTPAVATAAPRHRPPSSTDLPPLRDDVSTERITRG